MAAHIRIQTPGKQAADDLVEALARHGITGARRRSRSGGSVIAIDYDFEESERLIDEIDGIVEEWVRDQGLDTATVSIGERSHRVRAAA